MVTSGFDCRDQTTIVGVFEIGNRDHQSDEEGRACSDADDEHGGYVANIAGSNLQSRA